jgi:hypothetical protein
VLLTGCCGLSPIGIPLANLYCDPRLPGPQLGHRAFADPQAVGPGLGQLAPKHHPAGLATLGPRWQRHRAPRWPVAPNRHGHLLPGSGFPGQKGFDAGGAEGAADGGAGGAGLEFDRCCCGLAGLWGGRQGGGWQG